MKYPVSVTQIHYVISNLIKTRTCFQKVISNREPQADVTGGGV